MENISAYFTTSNSALGKVGKYFERKNYENFYTAPNSIHYFTTAKNAKILGDVLEYVYKQIWIIYQPM